MTHVSISQPVPQHHTGTVLTNPNPGCMQLDVIGSVQGQGAARTACTECKVAQRHFLVCIPTPTNDTIPTVSDYLAPHCA